MAGYREHVSVSGLLGVGYGVGATFVLGFSPVQGALAGVLTWVAGMLPDVDSDSGKPIREVFGLLAAVAPFVMMNRLLGWARTPDEAILAAVVLYGAIRYGASALLAKLSVHRGMFHSIPALLIATEVTFLAYKSDSLAVKLLMAGGVGLGFFSHLVLDEMYSVEWSGLRIKLNQFAGSALKFVGRSFLPNVLTYALLGVLTYASLVDVGLLADPFPKQNPPTLRQAVEEPPARG